MYKKIGMMRMSEREFSYRALAAAFLIVSFALVACAPVPQRVAVQPPPPPPPATQIYFYPMSGQTPEQQDRDRYECYGWAVKQSGFDPNVAMPPEQRVRIVPAPAPAHDTVIGAVAGAAIGALAAGPRNAGWGALIGGGAGALAGADSDFSNSSRPLKSNRPMRPGPGAVYGPGAKGI